MKKLFLLFIFSLSVFLLMTGSGFANTYTFTDDFIYWPGYPMATGDINFDNYWNSHDEVGSPTIKSMVVNTLGDPEIGEYLSSITVEVYNKSTRDSLFINTDANAGYEAWDYWVYSPGGVYSLYTVDQDNYTYTYAPYPNDPPGGRDGHPNGFVDDEYVDLVEDGVSVSYDGTYLKYVFNEYITLENLWAIAYTPMCANDVFLTPVPEPATMFLLGSGLIGLAAFGPKRFFKK